MTTLAVIGAGRGLGAAVARRFGREGFDVALISRNEARAQALAVTPSSVVDAGDGWVAADGGVAAVVVVGV
ncbi:short subunit dehydrogenase [Pseudonocardia sediminis]|uniref:Short subunit dehydrogenase n=1 Tax=Pseudonocardia sediminis TaxID=1397368 RepID=A0A4Q7USX1_PSEST|nr:short subunit dehydrogenase [Pseudonocardia sediminis]